LNIIKVGNRYVNLDLMAHAIDDDNGGAIQLQMAAPDFHDVGDAWITGQMELTFKGDEARQVREALDIAAAMNRWERAT
jgi:hypothetical protein